MSAGCVWAACACCDQRTDTQESRPKHARTRLNAPARPATPTCMRSARGWRPAAALQQMRSSQQHAKTAAFSTILLNNRCPGGVDPTEMRSPRRMLDLQEDRNCDVGWNRASPVGKRTGCGTLEGKGEPVVQGVPCDCKPGKYERMGWVGGARDYNGKWDSGGGCLPYRMCVYQPTVPQAQAMAMFRYRKNPDTIPMRACKWHGACVLG